MGSFCTSFLTLAAVCALLVIVAACTESTLPPESAMAPTPTAAVVQNQRSTVDTVVFNDCTGVDIALHGTAHVVFTTTQSSNGGSRYRSVSTSNSSFNAPGLPVE